MTSRHFKKFLKVNKKPIAVLYLEDKIKNWRESGNTLLIHLKDAKFKELIIRKQPIETYLPVMREYKWEIIASRVFVDVKNMDESSKKLYRFLKRFETQLDWYGFILRKPRFKTLSGPLSISNILPWVSMRYELATLLNSDKELIKFISRLRPDEIKIILRTDIDTKSILSLDKEYQKNALLKNIFKCYVNPKEIRWETYLIKGPIDEFTCTQKTFTNIYNILNRIFEHLEKISTYRHCNHLSFNDSSS